VQLAGRHVRRAATRTAAACQLVSYPLLLAVALLPGGHDSRQLACGLFAAVAAVSYLAEAFAARRLPYLSNLLTWVQVQLPLRFAFREIALIILMIRALPPGPARLGLFAGGLLGLHVLRGCTPPWSCTPTSTARCRSSPATLTSASCASPMPRPGC
jgi:hypothetical protein